ncbi:hypothetical protein OG601_28790 [Streptomyces sp. NBC_01239]|nr:hypothetical protein [Streptomyces sp. NBC_01239]MCX4814600.1 hypothetical protein [Streptomyces sp. NBC_01239]
MSGDAGVAGAAELARGVGMAGGVVVRGAAGGCVVVGYVAGEGAVVG